MLIGAGRVSIYCPPMRITRVDRKTKRTAAEPMIATIWLPSNPERQLTIRNVVIPETLVHRVSMFHWRVDQCTGSGLDNGNQLTVTLDAEDVEFDLQDFQIVAKAVRGVGTLTLADGQVGSVDVMFPDCVTDLFSMVASSVTAEGLVTFKK